MAIGEPMLLAYADTSGWRIYQRPTPLRPRQTVPLLLRSHPVPSGYTLSLLQPAWINRGSSAWHRMEIYS